MNAEEAMNKRIRQKGFSLLELLVALAILVIVAGTVISGMIRLTWSQSTITNRTQVHSSVRNATEMMQQEIGQAGRIAAQQGLQFTTAITVPAGSASVSATPTLTTTAATGASTDGLYVGEQLIVDPSANIAAGYNEETVTITAINTTSHTITATFSYSHAANTPVMVMGGFASGIIPPTSKYVFSGTGTTNTQLTAGTSDGSDGYTLKLYGDIYGDGTMYYVVYSCAPNTAGNGTLKRYLVQDVVNGTAGTLGSSGSLLLDTLATNPLVNGTPAPCFTYTTKDVAVTINGGSVTQTFVVNVAVTLTIQTQSKDLQTNTAQTETKALLNISPRN